MSPQGSRHSQHGQDPISSAAPNRRLLQLLHLLERHRGTKCLYRACEARTSGHVQDPEDGVGEECDGDTVRSNIAVKHVQPISARLLCWKINIRHVSTNECHEFSCSLLSVYSAVSSFFYALTNYWLVAQLHVHPLRLLLCQRIFLLRSRAPRKTFKLKSSVVHPYRFSGSPFYGGTAEDDVPLCFSCY